MAYRKVNFLGKYALTNKVNSVDFIKIWSHYDSDGSGYLERRELDNFLVDFISSRHGKELTEEELDGLRNKVMMTADVNRDGKIELGEFANLLSIEENFMKKFSSRKSLSRRDFNEIFMHYDPDGNGFIEGTELLALIRDIMTKVDQRVTLKDLMDYQEVVLSVFDKNTDGRLSRKELGLLLSIQK
ncbi:hypothetical protein HELRODRAFT_162085 [Helobdella robusta]|uniref:EF-hand domain-containing protein n=1 Tax=Helobdella robusta TaxID=6412 RepID=T1ES85_HELRO|nr:hypothetical protein HELRODRAFT_162085 [Helobdella robusta]ESN98647.1 hypothetical protein HELRODRAFT_162085 [Helobdella robusta]